MIILISILSIIGLLLFLKDARRRREDGEIEELIDKAGYWSE